MQGEISADTAQDLIKGAYQVGGESAFTVERGEALGHDVGYGADTDHRAFVLAVIDGYAQGCAARKELTADLVRREGEAYRRIQAAHRAARERILEAREAQAG